MLFWYCKEKFCLGHSWELTWLVTNQKFMSKPLMHWHVTSQNNLPRVPSLHQVMTTEEYWVHEGLHQELYSCLFLVVLQQEVQLSLRELIKIHCQLLVYIDLCTEYTAHAHHSISQKDTVCAQAEWQIQPKLIPASMAWNNKEYNLPPPSPPWMGCKITPKHFLRLP